MTPVSNNLLPGLVFKLKINYIEKKIILMLIFHVPQIMNIISCNALKSCIAIGYS